MYGRIVHLSMLFLLVIFSLSTNADVQEQLDETTVEYVFGEQITFHAKFHSNTAIKAATIFFQAETDTHTNLGEVTVKPGGQSVTDVTPSYNLSYSHSLADYRIRTFSKVDYHYEIKLVDGQTYKSPTFNFYYSDNRFNWQILEEKPFRVFWYEGDLAFAQSILDVSQEGLLHIQNLMPFSPPPALDIYVYTNAVDMQAVLNPTSANWVAGHADPDLGVIVVTLPPGLDRQLTMEQRLPHELAHILLYQSVRSGYASLPVWLNEGLASLSELYPNPDYRITLDNAVEKDSLLPISSLCNTFPRDASNALLSYAQSASFVGYLHDRYGTPGLQRLVSTYANGLGCEQGAKTALGTGLTQLERQWRRDALAENLTLTAFYNLLPWLILLAAALAVPLFLTIHRLRVKTA